MPDKCCVPFCKGNYNSGPKTSVFSIPKNEGRRQEWIKAINRKEFVPTKNHKVCELHFKESDFMMETVATDSRTGVIYKVFPDKVRIQLKNTAVPSIFPNWSDSKTITRRKKKAVEMKYCNTHKVTQSETKQNILQSGTQKVEPISVNKVINLNEIKVHELPHSNTDDFMESNRQKLLHWHKSNASQLNTNNGSTSGSVFQFHHTNAAIDQVTTQQVTHTKTAKVTQSDVIWSNAICQIKKKLIKHQPESNLEKQFDTFMTKYEGDNWRTNQKVKLNETELNSKAVIAAKMLAKKEASLLLVRKYKMLEFWKQHPKYAIVRAGLKQTCKLVRQKLWQKLTDILNNYDGRKRTQEEWITVWKGAKCHVRKKISKRMKLTDFEAQMAKFLSKFKAKGYSDSVNIARRHQDSKDAIENNTKRLEKDCDSTSNCDNNDEKHKSGYESDESDCFNNEMSSYEQKLNLLAYWKHHHLINGSPAPRSTKKRRRLWQEATVILNNCEGPKRSWREWSDVWSSWKNNVKRNVLSRKKMRKHLNIKLAEYILETDHLTLQDDSVDLGETCESAAGLANINQTAREPEILIITDDESDYINDKIETETRLEFKHHFDCHNNNIAAESTKDNDSNETQDFKHNLLEMHHQNLDFQEEVLDRREELVQSIEENFQAAVDFIQDMKEETFNTKNLTLKKKSLKKSQMTPLKNIPTTNNISKCSTESEFDSFGKNVVMQLEQLPPQIASETRKLIMQALKDSVVDLESEEIYIIQIMDEEWDSDVS